MTHRAPPYEERRVTIPWWAFDCMTDEATEVFWITGGLGAGKTYGSASWFLDRCFRNWRSPFSWAVAPTHTKVRDILFPAFQECLFEQYGYRPQKDYDLFISKPARLKFKRFNHEIHFHSGVRPDLMIGTNISHFLVTEVGLQDEAVFIRCQSRARCPKAELIQGMLEGTPEGINWYSQRADFDGYDIDQNARRFQLWTEDNHHLPEGYVDKLKRMFAYDPGRLESYLYGRFVPFTKGTAYWEFKHSRNVVSAEDVRPSPFLDILFTWDFGRSPLAWVAIQKQAVNIGYDARFHRYVAIEESSGKARGLMDAVAEFAAKFPVAQFGDTQIEIDGGHDGYSGSHNSPGCDFDQIYKFLRALGYRRVRVAASKAAPGHRESLENMARLMSYGLYVVSSRCTKLIHSHTSTALKEGTWDFVKNGPEDPTHYADAARYPMFRLTRHDNIVDPNHKEVYGGRL